MTRRRPTTALTPSMSQPPRIVSQVSRLKRRKTADWPPSDPVFLEAFLRRGESYTKSLPAARVVKFLDFFAGAGGMTSGFLATRQSGLRFESLGAFDIDAVALETLRLNTGVPTFEIDIREIAENPDVLTRLVPELTAWMGPLVFIGCPPCQGFSAHRKKDDRDDPRNNLINEFAKIVAHFRPEAVVMENVPEMIKGRYEDYYAEAANTLEGAGYTLSAEVIDLSKYGVPQRRRRAVVLASLEPGMTLPAPPLALGDVRTVRDAIGHLEPVAAGGTDETDPWHAAPDHTPRIIEKIKKIPADGGDRRHLPDDEQLACHIDVDQGDTPGFTDVYGRLRWDTPAVTITAKSSTPSCGRFLHPEQHRNITVREAALLQGFPHNYVFAGGLVHQYRQIGEAVPPAFARYLAFAVLDYFQRPARSASAVRANVNSAMRRRDRFDGQAPASVDLFCGAGGLSLGMAAAGFQSVLASDKDEDSVATFQKNIGRAIQGDVRDADFATLMDEHTQGRSYALVGGPPCQGFSQQRRGSNEDIRNDLVVRYAELVLEAKNRPRAVVLENVAYLDSPRGAHILEQYQALLTSNGYQLFRNDVNSANFAVPQTRPRILVFAIDVDFVDRFTGLKELTPNRWVTLGETLNGLGEESDRIANHVTARETAETRRRLAYVDMGRGRTAIPPDVQLACHSTYDGHLDVFGRLDWFAQARTITGGFDSASRGEYGHPFRNRSITAREAARIQGFPDDFAFLGNKSSVRRQIGNAVPPPLGYAIGRALAPLMG